MKAPIRPLLVLAIIPLAFSRADFDPARSPFANKPCDSYSSYTGEDGKPAQLLWGQAPLLDYGSRAVRFDDSGVRKLRPSPPPGLHPRIFFGPDDLPDVKKRVRETRCGQEAWKNILCWTEMMKGRYDDTQDYAKPDRWNGSFGGLHGRVPLFRMGVPRAKGQPVYNQSAPAAAIYRSLVDGTATNFPAFYWNALALEAFRCLIADDAAGGRDAAQAAVTMVRLEQAKRAADPKQQGKPPAQPAGGFQLAFTYDFLFNLLTPAQKTCLHDELAAGTWSHDNYGTFNTAESSRSNWATFSYWLFQVLAIEDEPGFNELKVRGMYRGWRNLLTYGWFESGATFEGEAKNQLGMDGVMPFLMRRERYGFDNLCGHPYLQSYARRFLPLSVNPMLTGFHKYDLLGGSRAGSGGATPMDMLGLKFMFPGDRTIDWIFRKAAGDNYESVPDRPDGYNNALLFFAIFASDFIPGNDDPAKLNLGNTFFCGERALMMTRSGWDKNALMLNMHTRQANGGHPFADRNGIMVAGAGRIWSPNGYASFRTSENSVVCIDGKSQGETVPGRCVDFVDAPQATFMVGDAKYTWDWDWIRLDKNPGYYTADDVRNGKVAIPPGTEPVLNSVNDFAFTKLPYEYLNWPQFRYAHWIKPRGAVSPYVRKPNLPVRKAFRTAGLVRGPSPYAIVVDDIQADDKIHRYDWTLALEKDIQIVSVNRLADGTMDIVLTGADPDQKQPPSKEALPSSIAPDITIPACRPMLWVKVLNRSVDKTKTAAQPVIQELPNLADPGKYGKIRRLVIPAESVAPDFKVFLHAYKSGQPVPSVKWDRDKSTATVTAGLVTDVIRFTPSAFGKTDVMINRRTGGAAPAEIIRVNKVIQPLADNLADQRAREETRIKAWVRGELAGFKPEALDGLVARWNFDSGKDSSASAINDPKLILQLGGSKIISSGLGKVLQCDGSTSGLTLPVDLSAPGGQGFTIAFRARDPDAKGGYFFSSNGAKGIGLGIEGQYLRVDAGGQQRWHKVPVIFQTWQHVVCTWDGRTFRIYLAGKEVANGEVSAPPVFAKISTLAPKFSGQIGELLLYRRALAAGEVEKIFAVQTYGPGGSAH